MLLSLIIYGYLLVLFHCLDTLTLNITNTNNQKYELGTIDTNNIIIFNADKTG